MASLVSNSNNNGSNNNGSAVNGGREYCLRWNNHQPNMVSFFGNLYTSESLVDVTLVSAEGKKIHAHKLVLSACSPYFQHAFDNNPCKHPIVILKDVEYVDLQTIVSFIYNGEVNISQDRINSILMTANSLQVKGLAEVPADELKRVSSVVGESSSSPHSTKSHQVPPLSSSASWAPGDNSDSGNDIPRKKLRKSASATPSYGVGSSNSNGQDHTFSVDSGVGASVNRSMDDGAMDDGTGPVVQKRSSLPAPPPLLPKSRSLDHTMHRDKHQDADMNLGTRDRQSYDDSSVDMDRGYELEVADTKIEAISDEGEIEFLEEEEEGEFDEETYGRYPSVEYDNDASEEHKYDNQSYKFQPNSSSSSAPAQRETLRVSSLLGGVGARPLGPRRKRSRANIEPQFDAQFKEAVKLVISGQASILKASKMCGIPKSTLYLRLKEMGITSSMTPHQQHLNQCDLFKTVGTVLDIIYVTKMRIVQDYVPAGAAGERRRRGRPLLRQPRIKRSDNDPLQGGSGGGGGRELYGGEFYSRVGGGDEDEEQSNDSISGPATSSGGSKPIPPEDFNNSRSPSRVPEDSNKKFISSSSLQKSELPIVRVSQCSPTPPSSPQHHHHHHRPSTPPMMHKEEKQPPVIVSNVSFPVTSSSSLPTPSSPVQHHHHHHHHTNPTLLAVPGVNESQQSSSTAHHHGHLVKQVSQPHLPSHTVIPLGGITTGNPVIKRQYSTPIPGQSSTSSNWTTTTSRIVQPYKSGTVLQIVPTSERTYKQEEEAASKTYIIDVIPSSSSSSGQLYRDAESPPFHRRGELKKAGSSEQQNSFSREDSAVSEEGSASVDDGLPVNRSGHCPALRPGPALGCNFCWNSVDSCGRILRRKTKYHCPECHINLCIVPCFQEYHEKTDKKKKAKAKLGLPKPSSM